MPYFTLYSTPVKRVGTNRPLPFSCSLLIIELDAATQRKVSPLPSDN
jgi:hypothetical protein